MCNSLPLSVGGVCDLLLTNRVWQRLQNLQDYIYMIMLHMIGTSVSLGISLPCWLWRSRLPCCELPSGEGHVARNGEWLTAKEKLKASVWQPARTMLPTITWSWKAILPLSSLRWEPSCGSHLDCRDLVKLCMDSWPIKLWDNTHVVLGC